MSVEKLVEWVWGVPTMVLLLAVGIILTWKTRFVQIRRFGASIRQVGSSLTGERSSFRAVCTALAGTVGTGNIAGVAGAIALGGPGAVFWMWVSAFLGMATKYAEVVLAMRYRQRQEDGRWRGGAMYNIIHGMGNRWKPMASFFALAGILVSFGMGNAAQVQTIASAAVTALPQIRPELVVLSVGLLTALLVLAVTVGGADRIGAVMERMVPMMAGLYLLGTVSVIVCFYDQLGTVFRDILQGAFRPAAVLGGGAGIGLRQTVRWGVARGVFSNEAGLGSAPMAYAVADAPPEQQGLLGIFEVFLDTVVLCTLTAVAILASGVPIPYGSAAGAELAMAAMQTVFGSWGPALMTVCIGFLAVATLISWQFYGACCAGFLWGSKGEQGYRLCAVGVVLLGATMNLSAVWAVSDLFNGFMCLPNLIVMLALCQQLPTKSS